MKLVSHAYNHVLRLLNLSSLRYGMLSLVTEFVGCCNLYGLTFRRLRAKISKVLVVAVMPPRGPPFLIFKPLPPAPASFFRGAVVPPSPWAWV